MAQETQSNIILKEEDKILKVEQGGCVPWGAKKTPYCRYSFMPCEHEQQYKKEYIEEFYNIGYDIIRHFSHNKVCKLSSSYSVKERHHNRKNKFTHPIYVESGKVNEFKQYLINSSRKDLLWTDYMYYVSDIVDYFLFKREVRSYARDIYILQEKLDFELVKKAEECEQEGSYRNVIVFVYPHSKIEHKNDTIINYVHSTDFLVKICFANVFSNIVIEPNPKHITYEQLLKEIEPIFNKYGWKFGDIENPYIKALRCDVNCLECDDLACNFNLKDNVVYRYVYHRVETD